MTVSNVSSVRRYWVRVSVGHTYLPFAMAALA